jgi:SPP1 family phage portal protein
MQKRRIREMINRPIDGEMNISEPVKRFSASLLDKLVEYHLKQEVPKYRKFQKLYEGKHRIANRRQKDENKPNNKISNDYFGQVIDNTLGYFLGNPVITNYTEPKEKKPELKTTEADVGVDLSNMEDTAVQDTLDLIFIDNDKDDLFMEWGKEAMIKGLSHVLVYQNEESKTKLMRLSPEDVILVYKNSSTKEVEYAIRLYVIDTEDTNSTTRYAEVYSADKIEIFSQTESATGKAGRGKNLTGFTFVDEKPHIFGKIPVVTFYNNEESMSDLEKIESLVNDYDKVLSDVSNEFEAYRNAYLLIKNMTMGNDSIQKLKDEGIVEVTDNGDMKFVTKTVQTEAIENHLTRLEKNVYKFSQVPDLSDENFAGNLSGVAIRFKLFGLETKCIIKERKMEKAIRNLFRVLSVPISVISNKLPDAVDLKIEFTRNVPNNITEIVDAVTKLDGKVDKETLLALLPFIDNPKEVLEKLKAEAKEDRKNNDPYSQQNVQTDSENLFPNLNAQPQAGAGGNIGGNIQPE